MANDGKTLRAAVYGRKSAEEGLEQSFNSLHAQREACEAFIISQRQEGWRLVPTNYEDGGFSGGTMDRPALQQLLADVQDGKVDIIVVYKVDRLTRSLADFAKMIEILDAHQASFVSVTQQFNTTSSMGRLTLNVLLSFAQFEREVTGERIRDKIAASKKKGMWMGGFPPLGYDVKDRKLVPNRKEAALVQKIFSLYLQLGSVSKLQEELERTSIRSKLWITRDGRQHGGAAFSRGALYDLLQNRLYVGEIRHRDVWYPGLHEGIIPRELWDRAQSQMAANREQRSVRIRQGSSSLLTGLVENVDGHRYTPSFTVKNKRRYRYYVCRARDQKSRGRASLPVPAKDLETVVLDRIRLFLNSESEFFAEYEHEQLSGTVHQLILSAKDFAERWAQLTSEEIRNFVNATVKRVIITESSIEVILHREALAGILLGTSSRQPPSIGSSNHECNRIRLRADIKRRRCGGEVCLLIPASGGEQKLRRRPVSSLIKAVVRAHDWHERLIAAEVANCEQLAAKIGLGTSYVSRVLPFACLAPDIVDSILQGTQPADLTFGKMLRNIPLCWAEQRERFGFPPVP